MNVKIRVMHRNTLNGDTSMYGLPATVWATDYWGPVETEPTEEHARKVARRGGANVYSRSPLGAWIREDLREASRGT